MTPDDLSSRRPLASRASSWARHSASLLARLGATPNGISIASVFFALAGFLLLARAGSFRSEGLFSPWFFWGAAAMAQARLLCNLLDGMVAVEHQRKTPDGSLFNEAPDRLADFFLLWGAGLACGSPSLGLAAAALAILTAYQRALSASLGLPQDFRGPMAKPHRMAALTAALIASGLLSLDLSWTRSLPLTPSDPLGAALWIIALGSALTFARRFARARRLLLTQDRSS